MVPTSNGETVAAIAVDHEPITPSDMTASHDVQKCKKFVERTCKCNLAEPDGSPCSNQFPVEHYVQTRAQANFLTRDELNLVILGYIQSAALLTTTIIDDRHANPAARNRVTMKYKHRGVSICRKTFLFLHGVGKD